MSDKALTAIALIFFQLFNLWNVKHENKENNIYIKAKIKRTKAKLRKELYHNNVSSEYLDTLLQQLEVAYLKLGPDDKLPTLEEIYSELKTKKL